MIEVESRDALADLTFTAGRWAWMGFFKLVANRRQLDSAIFADFFRDHRPVLAIVGTHGVTIV